MRRTPRSSSSGYADFNRRQSRRTSRGTERTSKDRDSYQTSKSPLRSRRCGAERTMSLNELCVASRKLRRPLEAKTLAWRRLLIESNGPQAIWLDWSTAIRRTHEPPAPHPLAVLGSAALRSNRIDHWKRVSWSTGVCCGWPRRDYTRRIAALSLPESFLNSRIPHVPRRLATQFDVRRRRTIIRPEVRRPIGF